MLCAFQDQKEIHMPDKLVETPLPPPQQGVKLYLDVKAYLSDKMPF